MEIENEPPCDGANIAIDLRLRPYQAEMVEESLRVNIIVAMDTGSGKTHIALARTHAELERCHPDQLVWFLVPTVTLCEQQEAVFQKYLPAFGIKALSGKDDVDRWTDQATWDIVLKNVRVVLSTHQVLKDALVHAFVKMQRIALIIFDEAHHCTLEHPANQIMKYFYKPLLRQSEGVGLPGILGLSASPLMRAKATGASLQSIEHNLNAITRTPKIHRKELMDFVHKPNLSKVIYQTPVSGLVSSPLLGIVQNMLQHYDFKIDPYVLDLQRRHRAGEKIENQIQKFSLKKETYCQNQIKKLSAKGGAMLHELGASATEWYLHQCIFRYEQALKKSDSDLLNWSTQEKDHLSALFRGVTTPDEPPSLRLDHLSDKVERLINILVDEACEDFAGLIFVEQRVWVVALAEILALHPKTANLFNIGTFVGDSNTSKRRTLIADLTEPRNQQGTLDDFRAGKKNLILATSVLEEGIDVSSCNLVICFESPKNLKSFIQRRGRARKQKSNYIIMLPASHSVAHSPQNWHSLEKEMIDAYLDDLRVVQRAKTQEMADEVVELTYRVPTTGALLTIEDATQHLHHFCSVLSSGPYTDSRPQFNFHEDENGLIIADVTLPISVDPVYRLARSQIGYRTERMALKDAAFQAYIALHKGGLVNDNLLPNQILGDDEAAEFNIPNFTPSLVEVSPQFDPWINIAVQQRNDSQSYHCNHLTVESPGKKPIEMIIMVPCALPELQDLVLHWNESVRYRVQSLPLGAFTISPEKLALLQLITRRILYSIFSGRMQEIRYDFLWLLAPCASNVSIPSYTDLQNWLNNTEGTCLATELLQSSHIDPEEWGLVNLYGDNRKYMAKKIEFVEGLNSQLQAIRTPRRRDFLHSVAEEHNESQRYKKTEWLEISECEVSNLATTYSIFALFVPSILQKYEVSLLVETLRTTILEPLSIDPCHSVHILRAITSSATGEESDYQRVEFLGDCILKLISTVHLLAAHLNWPESFLTAKKGKVVSNGFLARATMTAGLDKFIIDKRFTGSKWYPKYAGDVLSQGELKQEQRSSKLLADVVESLIGTSYLLGGFAKAFICTQLLLPMEPWTPIPEANTILLNAAPSGTEPTDLSTLEELIGYTFEKKLLLLEAMTHASYSGPNAHSSYERLEFLGDAVLDYIITKRMYAHTPELSHQQMHAVRTSMANAAFLSFRMFETTLEQTVSVDTVTMQPGLKHTALWQFMRHSSPQIVQPRDAALQQHAAHREEVLNAVAKDVRFPWHLLALADSPKFLSDIVESVIGAIYIDSHGSIESCEIFVRRLGILCALERILRDGVDCLHPKERLGHLAVEKSVQYVKLDVEAMEGDKKRKEYMCQVKVGGEEVGGRVEGLKRLNAETIAAWRAVKILEDGEDVQMGEFVQEYVSVSIRAGEGDAESCVDEWHDAEDGFDVDLEMAY
ncbi:dicer-like protein 2 [Polyplosphaeria fusca]|uniref:Dicer-like protein 2 n=1 Tax=Polyplosphaeria fusca TaxID=682080 RepID=A0A9P4V5W5_9PLEO|nr:dicer-like protein 2 [Polyplosphaeria fusca]